MYNVKVLSRGTEILNVKVDISNAKKACDVAESVAKKKFGNDKFFCFEAKYSNERGVSPKK